MRQEIVKWSSRDGRIKSIYREENGNILGGDEPSGRRGQGEFLVFLDHDDLLERDARLKLSARYLDAHPQTDLVYSDDDKIDNDGEASFLAV